MKKYFLIIFLFILSLLIPAFATDSNTEIIGTVNGEELLTSQFNRLLNAQMKKFYLGLNFDLFSPDYVNPEIINKRIEYLNKARAEGFSIKPNEVDKAVDDLISQNGNIENLISNAQKNNIPIANIKNKLAENLLLEKYYESKKRQELITQMVDEILVLQEAKSRNLIVPNEEVTKKLDLLISKQGGILPFLDFLKQNNATVQDAENEIRKKMVYDLVKQEVLADNKTNDTDPFKSFITDIQTKANIIVYINKVEGKEVPITAQANTANTEITDTASLRTKPYPTLTRTKVNQIAELEQKTNKILEAVNSPDVERVTDESLSKELLAARGKNSGFAIFKNRNDVPTLTKEQDDYVTSHLNHRSDLLVEGIGQSFEEANTAREKDINNLDKVELAKINELQVIKPLKDVEETPLNIISGKSIIIKPSGESLKTKWSKYKLARGEKKKIKEQQKEKEQMDNLLTQPNIIPGEPIAEQKQNTESEHVSDQNIKHEETANQVPNIQPQAPAQSSFSKELEELRHKIEQRRVTLKD